MQFSIGHFSIGHFSIGHFSNVRNKIFLGMLSISALLLMLMTFMVKESYTVSLKRNEINFHIRATNRTKYQFDFILDVINRTVHSITMQNAIIESVKTGTADFSLHNYLQSLQTVQPFLGDITVIGKDGQFYSSNLALSYKDLQSVFEKCRDYFKSGGQIYYFGEGYAETGIVVNASPDVFTGAWPIYDTKSQEFLGGIFVGLNYSIFQEMFILAPITNGEKFVMINSGGDIIFSYPAYESFDSVLKAYPRILERGEAILEGDVFGLRSIIVTETSSVLGWKFVRIIDAENIIPDTRKMQEYFNIVFVLSIIIILLFSLFFSKQLTKPIQKLVAACKRIESGDMMARVTIETNDEMGQLGRTFNLIMDKINENFEQSIIEQQRKNELKIEVLQAQINPHFLYNTLDSIKFLATLQEVHNIASMCASLITLLKYNLSPVSFATLGEEIESVKCYVEIQKYRYGDIFEFHLDIAPETEDCLLTRFILQPLVENSLVHGFEERERGGEITVRSCIEGDRLCLQVIDNGNGMEGDALHNLNSGIEPGKRYNNIGVNNISERIRLQFGDTAALRYNERPGGGVIATIFLPIKVKKISQLPG